MNMKEACQYMVESRRKRNSEHRLKILAIHGEHGFIDGFTPSEERQSIKDSMKYRKKSFTKGKGGAHNRIWKHYNIPI